MMYGLIDEMQALRKQRWWWSLLGFAIGFGLGLKWFA